MHFEKCLVSEVLIIDRDPKDVIPPICESDVKSKLFAAVVYCSDTTNDKWLYLSEYLEEGDIRWYGCSVPRLVNWQKYYHEWPSAASNKLLRAISHVFIGGEYTTVIYRLDNTGDVYSFMGDVKTTFGITVPEDFIFTMINRLCDRSAFS